MRNELSSGKKHKKLPQLHSNAIKRRSEEQSNWIAQQQQHIQRTSYKKSSKLVSIKNLFKSHSFGQREYVCTAASVHDVVYDKNSGKRGWDVGQGEEGSETSSKKKKIARAISSKIRRDMVWLLCARKTNSKSFANYISLLRASSLTPWTVPSLRRERNRFASRSTFFTVNPFNVISICGPHLLCKEEKRAARQHLFPLRLDHLGFSDSFKGSEKGRFVCARWQIKKKSIAVH